MNILIENGSTLRGGKVVKESIFIKDGKLSGSAKNFNADRVIDASGLYVLDGLFDMHAHLREPGFEYKEDIATGTKAAVKGGFTGVCCMPNTRPVLDEPSVVSYVTERAKAVGACRVYPIAAITKGQKGAEITEMRALKDAGAVALSDDGLPVLNGNVMRLALEYAKTVGIPLIAHEEDTEIAAGGVVNEGYHATVAGLRGISRVAEESMIARDILLAESLEAGVHIAHVSTKGGVELIRQAKKRGVKVTAETCPHYFAATDKLILSFDTNTKVNPPLRTEDDRLAIIAGLKDGSIDAIATDHAPHSKEDKFVEYNYAANGISGFETAFALAYTFLVKAGELSIAALNRLMSVNPRKILGIDRGDADFTVVDLSERWVIDPEKFVSKGKNSPFKGFAVYGKVKYTVVGGKIAYEDRAI